MTWLFLPLTTSLLVSAWILHRARRADTHCPNCTVEYEVVAAAGDGPNHSYDVLACPMCANTSTRMQGRRSQLAWCPACRNRSLETPCMRLPGDGLRVEVRENCPICEFERTFTAGEGEPRPLGKVIPFPLDRTRRRVRAMGEPKVEDGGSPH